MKPFLTRRILLLGFLFLAACSEETGKPLTIHMVGDSTMADKPDPEINPERGWGQVFPEFFDERVTVANHARNGRSSRSFMGEGRWNRVMQQMEAGDYVFIQFGHNDQKEYDPRRYSNPWSAYRRNLERMVEETLERGGNPVLLSSIVRRNFNEENTLTDSHGPYPFVARSVARDMGIPFIDLQQMSEDLVAALGPKRSEDLLMILEPGEYAMYPEGRKDNTHLRIRGAGEIAGLVAREIRKQGFPLAEYLSKDAMKPRVLAITGGHSYDTTEFFQTLVSLTEFHFDSIIHPDARRLLASEHAYAYDALLFYDFKKDLPLRDSSIYLNLARRGMPMLFLHHALGTFQGWKGYRELTGGMFVAEEAGMGSEALSGYRHDLDLKISIAERDHPVTRDLEDFSIHDEAYSNLWIREGITPLLTTGHPDCSSLVGWANTFDRSTTIWLLFGHDKKAYENPAFKMLVGNSLSWLTDPGTRP